MRARLLVVILLVLAGCGGGAGDERGDDGAAAPAGESSVLRSEDGRAALALPAGADADDLTIEAVEIEGAAVAFELGPSGTTFDEPATLTVTDVVAPPGNPLAFVLVESDDGEAELLEGVETAYLETDEVATITAPITHFSTLTIGWILEREGETGRLDSHTVAMAMPTDVVVGVPFEVAVGIEPLDRRLDLEIPWWRDIVLTVEEATGRGSLVATNATPATARNLPPFGVIDEPYRGTRSFTCRRPGTVTVTWTINLTLRFEESYYGSFNTTDLTSSTSERIERLASCAGADGETTTSSTSTTVAREAVPPVVERLTVDLVVPVTTYSVRASDPSRTGGLSYTWRMVGESCGTPATPWEQRGATVRWSHSEEPPDSCAHRGTDHDVQVSVTVTNGAGLSVTCSIAGSESRVIDDPPCS